MLPVSGSAYSTCLMGERAAWVMGLLLILEYGLTARRSQSVIELPVKPAPDLQSCRRSQPLGR